MVIYINLIDCHAPIFIGARNDTLLPADDDVYDVQFVSVIDWLGQLFGVGALPVNENVEIAV